MPVVLQSGDLTETVSSHLANAHYVPGTVLSAFDATVFESLARITQQVRGGVGPDVHLQCGLFDVTELRWRNELLERGVALGHTGATVRSQDH